MGADAVEGVETLAGNRAGDLAFAHAVTATDLCLIRQGCNGRRRVQGSASDVGLTEDQGVAQFRDIRLLARAASGLGLSALLLAVAGVYSVVAFLVSLRTQEFGIRLAIGARPGDIVNMVVGQSSRLVAVGLVAGLVLGAPVLILIGKTFPYASAFDPLALLGPAMGLALTALVAAAIPARRAARVDPCSALRSE